MGLLVLADVRVAALLCCRLVRGAMPVLRGGSACARQGMGP